MKKLLTGIFIALFTLSITVSIVFVSKENNTECNNKTANIVFTSDAEYKNYLKVALKSAIMNKKADSIYNINILSMQNY